MSGRRTAGSSVGRGTNVIGDEDPARSRMVSASSSIDISAGLPMLTGPGKPLAASARTPSTVSST